MTQGVTTMDRRSLPLLVGALFILLSACSASSSSQPGGTEGARGSNAPQQSKASAQNESVPYGIYVGARVTGQCSAYHNSGGFRSMDFDAEFQKIVFVKPTATGQPGPYGGIYKADSAVRIGLPGIGLLGKGKIGGYAFCPDYDEAGEHPCHLTAGPHPFQPTISIYPDEPSTYPDVPLVGTHGPLGGGTSIIVFSIGAADEGGPIMQWEGDVGGYALGGALEPTSAPFPVTWDQLILGEGFSIDIITGDEWETWNWTMRFVPQG